MSLPYPNSFKQNLITKLSRDEKIKMLKEILEKKDYRNFHSIVDIFLSVDSSNGGLNEDDIEMIMDNVFGENEDIDE
jgi:hypothetical protein